MFYGLVLMSDLQTYQNEEEVTQSGNFFAYS